MTPGFRRSSMKTTVIAWALLALAACSSGSDGGGNSGGARSGQGGASVTGSGGASMAGSGGTIATGSGGTTATGLGGTSMAGTGGGNGGRGEGGSAGTLGQAGGTLGGGGQAGATAAGGQVAGATGSGGRAGATGVGGQVAGATGSGGQIAGSGGGAGTAGAGGQVGAGGQAGRVSIDGGSQTGGATGTDAGLASNCVGKAWPTADPTVAGPFTVAADKNVGPLAGYTPDPIYGDTQQRFNVYRPQNLATSGYCHPILVWANGHGDNPEQNPPLCVVNSATNQWCGTYPVIINQLASQGFVVIASLSTTTSRGDPLPTIVGLDWLLQQAEDATSPYYHHLDTTRIGALGHSEGGASTCIAAADPRISAIGTISGTRTLTGLHGPALFICGGKDTVVSCDSVQATYATVTDQPAMFLNNLAADHGGWEYQNGAKGPDIFAMTAWFRVLLMDDTANRKYFYGTSCTLCTDSRVTVQRNSLMTQ
jgi:hypothetical protein